MTHLTRLRRKETPMNRPTPPPSLAAKVRRAGQRLLVQTRAAGTPVGDEENGYMDEAATIAKHLRPGDLLIAQEAYRMCVQAMVADVKAHGCTWKAAIPLEQLLSEFIEQHGWEYHDGRFRDMYSAVVSVGAA